MNNTIDTILKRVSLRTYSPELLSIEHEEMIMDCALRAPTARNMMLFSVIKITDKEKKEKLVETCDNHSFIAEAPLVLIFLADMQRWYDYYTVSGVPEHCKKNRIDYITPGPANLMMACCDALLAAQNAVIAAESVGIGSCYVGDIMGSIETHRELFNLPEWVFPITMLCFGYYPETFEKRHVPKFKKEFICFDNSYERLKPEDFDRMFTQWDQRFDRYKERNPEVNHLNNAQFLYPRFSGDRCSEEENRSVRMALKDWGV